MPAPKAILMRPDEIVGLKRAALHAGRSVDTIRRWSRHYGIARQAGPGAPLEVSLLALEMVLHSDFDALEELRAGRRGSPLVVRFLDHLGLAA